MTWRRMGPAEAVAVAGAVGHFVAVAIAWYRAKTRPSAR